MKEKKQYIINNKIIYLYFKSYINNIIFKFLNKKKILIFKNIKLLKKHKFII